MKNRLANLLLVMAISTSSSCLSKRENASEWMEASRDWQKEYLATQNFLRQNPDIYFSPNKSYELNNWKENHSLEGLSISNFTTEIARDIAQTHLFFHERIPSIIDYLKENTPETRNSYEKLQSLLKNPEYIAKLEEIYGSKEADCRMISSTILAIEMLKMVRQKQEGSATLVTGIYFGEIAKKGIGHQWIEINGLIVDPSLRPSGNLEKYNLGERYIPIVKTEMVLRGEKAEGKTEIVTMPKELLYNYSEQ